MRQSTLHCSAEQKSEIEAIFTRQNFLVLCDWTFDLDRLQPDKDGSRVRSPIGWMQQGSEPLEYWTIDSWMSRHVKCIDPYKLFLPDGKPYVKQSLSFTNIKKDIGVGQESLQDQHIPLQSLQPDVFKPKNDAPYHIKNMEVDSVFENLFRPIDFKEYPAGIICEVLGADNPLVQDVVLAHTLINGNTELARRIMTTYDEPSIVRVKGRRPSELVGPTLAHLLILQKIDRRPIPDVITAILRGASFKVGYVESSVYFPGLDDEDDVASCRSYQSWRGEEDDEPLMTLFKEKAQLEELDSQKRAKRGGAGSRSQSVQEQTKESGSSTDYTSGKASGRIDAELEDRKGVAEVDELDLEGRYIKMIPNIDIDTPLDAETISLIELLRRSKSISLWRKHIEVLHWLEERKKKARIVEAIGNGTAAKARKSLTRFSDGLAKSLQSVLDLQLLLDGHVKVETEKRRRAVKEVKAARLAAAQTTDQVKKSYGDGGNIAAEKTQVQVEARQEDDTSGASSSSVPLKRSRDVDLVVLADNASHETIVNTTVDGMMEVKRRRSSRLANK